MKIEEIGVFEGLVRCGLSTGEISVFLDSDIFNWRKIGVIFFDNEFLQQVQENTNKKRILAYIKAKATKHRLIKLGVYHPIHHSKKEKYGVYKKCIICEKVFYVAPYMKEKAKFCSSDCYHKYMRQYHATAFYNQVPWNKGLTTENSERIRDIFTKRRGMPSDHKNKTYIEMYGELKARELRENLSYKLKGRKLSQQAKENLSIKIKKLYENDEYIKRKLSGEHRSPNNFEQKFIRLISELKLNIKYTGDKSFWLYLTKEQREKFHVIGINPDFIVEPFSKTKKVVELFGDYFHTKDDEQIKKSIYNELGFEVLIIWEGISLKEIDKTMQSLINFTCSTPINVPKLTNGKRVFMIDIDGVLACTDEQLSNQYMLAKNSKFKELQEAYVMASPKKESILKLNKFYDEGNVIILWTSRHEEDRIITKQWLTKYGVKYHILLMNKISADYYIDDRGLKSVEEIPNES